MNLWLNHKDRLLNQHKQKKYTKKKDAKKYWTLGFNLPSVLDADIEMYGVSFVER